MRRRQLLKTLVSVTAMGMTPPLRAAPAMRTLVLLEFNGGNDGLNTVVPFADPGYSDLRPKIGLKRDAVLALDERMGLHSALKSLHGAWRGQELAIVQGLGYPRPNRSHFRSIEIWDTASDADEYLTSGWIAGVIKQSEMARTSNLHAVVLGRPYAGPVAGGPAADTSASSEAPGAGAMRTILMRQPEQYLNRARRLAALQASTSNAALAHLLSVRANVFASAKALGRALDATNSMPLTHPGFNSTLGKQLAVAARLIVGGARIPVIKVSQTGFDTHAGQVGKHRALMTELDGAIGAFRHTLTQAGHWQDTLLATYSEFGRRARENSSGGTDHGTAAPHFVLGGRVRGGLYGDSPSLRTLDDGDLRYTVDFRNYYASIAKDWWGVTSASFSVKGDRTLGFLRTI